MSSSSSSSSSSTPTYNLVGNTSVNRRDITRKITGSAVYAYDINPSHVGETSFVYMGKITCPYPSAQIVKIDATKALAAGYVVLTAQDLAAFSMISGARPHLPLPEGQTYYPGQMVAVVGASTTDGVEDAIGLVDVEFKPLPYVLDAEEASQPGAVQIWPGGNIPGAGFNPETGPVPATLSVSYGDVDAALASADATITTTLNFPLHQHFEMEPRACVASWKNNTLTIWASNQYVHSAQSTLANYFRVPLNTVTVKSGLGGNEGGGVVGMALGDKSGAAEEMILAAVMAQKVGAAVKYGPTRFDQALNNTSAKFPIKAYMTLGGTKDGTMTAMKGQFYVNVGAYGGSNGSDSLSDFYNAYMTPNVELTSTSVNTNAFAQAGPMRDVGESQAHFFMEVAVDMMAEKLGIDPVQFRLQNMRTSANAVDPVSKLPYTGFGEPGAFNNAVTAFGWSSKFQGWGVASAVSGTVRTGVGIALQNSAKGSIIPPSTGQIQVNTDGSVVCYTGLTDHGAGGNTTFPIMAAEYLGLTSLANVTCVQSDTSLTTSSSVTAGSQSTRNAGMAFSMAAADLKRQWFPIVAAKLGTTASNLSFSNGNIVSADGTLSISFKDAAALLSAPITGVGVFSVPTNVAWRVGGAKLVELQVDIETGDVHITNYVSGLDIGKVIFAKGAESQVRGGFYGMGMGETLYQELLQDPTTGSYINPNFHDFRVPTIMEVPDAVTATWDEYVDPIGPFGAKGIGENVLIAVSPAIVNALSNALGGQRFDHLPVSRQDIMNAIAKAQEAGAF